jgi:hypothetical protein
LLSRIRTSTPQSDNQALPCQEAEARAFDIVLARNLDVTPPNPAGGVFAHRRSRVLSNNPLTHMAAVTALSAGQYCFSLPTSSPGTPAAALMLPQD